MSNYFRIENTIFEFGLKPIELSVYSLLCRFKNNESHTCYPTRETISQCCNMSLSSVDRALKTLCNRGLVIKTPRFDVSKHSKQDSQRSNLYHVINPSQISAGHVNVQPLARHQATPAGVTNLHRTKLDYNKTICNTTSTNAEIFDILADCMLHTLPDHKLAQAIEETIIEMWHAEFIVVDGKQVANSKVRDKLDRIGKEHIDLAIQKVREFDYEIKNERKFFMACIYNAVSNFEFATDRRVAQAGWY